MIHRIRAWVFPVIAVATAACAGLGLLDPLWWWGLVALVPLALVGLSDLLQSNHSLLRNYPVLGHLRFLLEDVGPELRQYFVESNTEGRPFDRDQRSLMYARAKDEVDKKPFGTEQDVYASGYGWIEHSMAPRPAPNRPAETLRVDVGGPQCERPYSASVFNISAMSFGAISPNGILALNDGAKRGGFFHNTGEGGVSRYHRERGGDLVWQLGTAYFGCRSDDGKFDSEQFVETARLEQVRMIELKLSQGAKPGHGGILPGAKVNREIADARRIPIGMDCISPPYHTAFSTPIGLLEFVAELRDLAGGKPVGFKLCVGDPAEFFAVCKAMLETGILPDFITVDGAEGGTGAAPIEFSDHVGTPLKEGLVFVHNALVGIGVREHLKLAASAKRISGFDIASAMALGADWCNSARGFMFALGCIQAQQCHTNRCPVGVATQNPLLNRALVVDRKARRVRNFHQHTVEALAEVIAAAGLEHPSELAPRHIYQRIGPAEVESYDQLYDFFAPGQLCDGHAGPKLQRFWDAASAKTFRDA